MSRRAVLRRSVSRRALLISSVILSLTLLLLTNSPIFACAITGSLSYQPRDVEVSAAFERAGSNFMAPEFPGLYSLEVGHPDATLQDGQAPCVILKSIGYVESAWQQAVGSVPEGQTGPTKVSPSCGHGIMQITSGMRKPGELEADIQDRIAREYMFNVAWGARLLTQKWNGAPEFFPPVGNRDPTIAENWYYAVWAYNGWLPKNNPNNPDLPWPRPLFDGAQSRSNYPYQELVWGFAANPPKRAGVPLWKPVALTLPKREDVGLTPQQLNTPQPAHTSPCSAIRATPNVIAVTLWEGKALPPWEVVIEKAPGGEAPLWQASASSSAAWLKVSPSSGSSYPARVSVAVNAAGLATGSYKGDIAISTSRGDEPVRVRVELRVTRPPKLFFPFITKSKDQG